MKQPGESINTVNTEPQTSVVTEHSGSSRSENVKRAIETISSKVKDVSENLMEVASETKDALKPYAEAAKASAEDLAYYAIEGAKDFGRDVKHTIQATAEKYGTFVYESGKQWTGDTIEAFKRTTTEWKDDVVSTLRMNTVEKFKFLSQDAKDNALLKIKNFEIYWCNRKIEKREKAEAKLVSRRDASAYKYDKAIEGIEDPDLKAQFEKQRDEALQGFDRRLASVREKKEFQLEKKAGFEEQATEFQESIQGAKEDFSSKIDSKIEDVSDRYRLQERSQKIEELAADIEAYQITVGEKKVEAEKLRYIISQKELGTWASRRKVKKEVANLEASIKLHEKEIKRLGNLKRKLDGIVSHGKKKVGEWEKFRATHLGASAVNEEAAEDQPLVEPEAATEEVTDSSTEEVNENPESEASAPQESTETPAEPETSPAEEPTVEDSEDDPTPEQQELKAELGPKLKEPVESLTEGLTENISPLELLRRVDDVEKVIIDNESTIAPSEKDLVEQIKIHIEGSKKPAEGKVIRKHVLKIIMLSTQLIETT